jgi:Fe-S cluster assembly protein SufD
MSDTPHIVLRPRKIRDSIKALPFSKEMIRFPGGSNFIDSYREKAWKEYDDMPIPTTLDEAWRRTDIKGLHIENLQPPAENIQNLLSIPSELLQPPEYGLQDGQVLMAGTNSQSKLDQAIASQGVIFTDLQTAEREYPKILEKVMGKVVKPSEGKFAGLTSALASNGLLLYVPPGVKISQPLHSLYWGPDLNRTHLTHIMFYLEEGASATFLHEFASPTEVEGQSFHSGIVEGYVGPSARLKFVELQSWGEHVWNFTHERVQIDRDGHLDWIIGCVGSKLTKSFIDIDLINQGSSSKVSGFYLAHQTQHLDIDTQQNHLASHTTSNLLFKGALLGESRVVWQGMIYVAPDAAKIDGYQTNNNLVLSQNARVDSIPGLEILADDVKCSHGATVGNIEQDQLFYLLSRGIPRGEAEKLIIEGFYNSVMRRIPVKGVRERFERIIDSRVNGVG